MVNARCASLQSAITTLYPCIHFRRVSISPHLCLGGFNSCHTGPFSAVQGSAAVQEWAAAGAALSPQFAAPCTVWGCPGPGLCMGRAGIPRMMSGGGLRASPRGMLADRCGAARARYAVLRRSAGGVSALLPGALCLAAGGHRCWLRGLCGAVLSSRAPAARLTMKHL